MTTKRTEPPGWVAATMKAIARTLSPHLGRIDALERRLAELEGSTKMLYRGVWKPGATASKGEFWTHAGSVWHANETTDQQPGADYLAWTLAVKRGRDARTKELTHDH
ncbi:hypothetical protein ACKVEX_15175 [Rhodocyclaceae bacterium SMB388]